METWEIKNALTDRIRDVCSAFLPGGFFDTHYYRCGSVHGGKGDSCVVHLDGSRKGQFFENAPKGGEVFTSGSTLDLIMSAQNISDVREGLLAAARFLGVSTARPQIAKYSRRPQAGSSPLEEPKKSGPYEELRQSLKTYPLMEDGDVYDYLVNERMISPDVLKRYNVVEGVFPFSVRRPDGTREYKQMKGYAFHFRSPDGKTVLGTKYFALERDYYGKKYVQADKGFCAERYHLFGMQCVPRDADELIICEGEIDALTLASLGYNAVSVPFGAKADSDNGENSGNRWIENDWEWLSQFTKIKICMDCDEAGKLAAETLMNRLNLYRTELVELPEGECGKDPNDLFRNNVELLKRAVENSRPLDPARLRHMRDYDAKIKNLFFPADGREPGRRLPWTLPDGDGGMNVRDGEVTVVSGYSKHGKTTLLDYVCVRFAADYDERIFIASLEIGIERTAQVLWRQCMGRRRPIDEYGKPDMDEYYAGLDWLDEHFFAYDSVGRVSFDELLSVMIYAAQRYGVKIFVLDSLMKLGVRKDDLNGQNELLDRLDVFAKQYNCHVFLVAHAKKPQDKVREWKTPPDKQDVEGSGDITNIACNTWVVQRNYQKERDLADAEYKLSLEKNPKKRVDMEAEIDMIRHKPDAMWIVRAQRWGDGSTPQKFLYFNKESWTYSEVYNFIPQRLVEV